MMKGKDLASDTAISLNTFDEWLCCVMCGEYRSNCECDHAPQVKAQGLQLCRVCETLTTTHTFDFEERERELCLPCAFMAGYDIDE